MRHGSLFGPFYSTLFLQNIRQNKIKKVKTKRSIVKNEHAAVIVEMDHLKQQSNRNVHIKLDNNIVKNRETLCDLNKYYNSYESTY